MNEAATEYRRIPRRSGWTLSLLRVGGGFLLQLSNDSWTMCSGLRVLEHPLSGAVVRRCFRVLKAASKRKAWVKKSPSGEHGTDNSIETNDSPKRISRKSFPRQRTSSRSCIRPASWSASHVDKKSVPTYRVGRTESLSPANCLIAQEPITSLYHHSPKNDMGWAVHV